MLSALLFLLYINDLPKNVKSAELCLFADDTTLITRSKSTENAIEQAEMALGEAVEWFQGNELSLNVEKTQKIIVSTKNNSKEEIQVVKFLGVTLNNVLGWANHVELLSRKLASAIYAIRRMLKISTLDTAITTYHAYFMTKATYGILAWGASTETNRIFILQKQAVRTLAGADCRASCREIFRSLRLLTLPSVYILRAIMFIHNNKDQQFPTRNTIHEHDTRNSQLLITPRHRLTRTQRTPSYSAIKLYNALPTHMKNLNPGKLHATLKELLISNVPYSIDEFTMLFK